MARGFEPVGEVQTQLPTRADSGSAGYDLFAPYDGVVDAHSQLMMWTGVKAYMEWHVVLLLFSRSSMGKHGVTLANCVGVIDSSYYNNASNGGNIGVLLRNDSDQPFYFRKGQAIGQAVFLPFLPADDDIVRNSTRTGGFGSSDRKDG